MGKISNYPTKELENIEKPIVKEIVTDLKQLHELGRPKTDAEVADRIDSYFAFCQESSIRPGVESLCLSLHISRQTLFRWCSGEGCSEYRQELAQSAKALVSAYIEQASLSGRINPATSIFLMKNWMGYRDSPGENEVIKHSQIPGMTVEEIARERGVMIDMVEPEKPDLDDY